MMLIGATYCCKSGFMHVKKREGNTVEKERVGESESYCKSLGYTKGAK